MTQLTSTTLAVAITSTTAQQITLASVAGIGVNYTLFVDREAMQVLAINGNVVTVERGIGRMPAMAHVVSAVVLAGTADQFYNYDPPSGGPVVQANTAVSPWINLTNGNQWTCAGGVWVLAVSPGMAMLGANAFTGQQTVMGGNVGIGTISPGNLLSLSQNTTSATTYVSLNNTAGGGTAVMEDFQQSGVMKGRISSYFVGGGLWGLQFATDAGLAMTVTNTNVGIGTATPHSKLAVVGLAVYANNAAAIVGGLAAGDFYRTGVDPDFVAVVH